MNVMKKGKEAKPHIGIYGRRNNGKSSLINVLAGQDIAIVSDFAGTTTDPVKKSFEITGFGPVVLIDTAGIDDEGNLLFSDSFPDKFKKKISVTSSILISNNMIPFDTEDIIKKKSIYQDYSNKSLLRYGLDLPVFTPEDAAEVLYNTSADYDLILYEFFQSDIYGHRKNLTEQVVNLVLWNNYLQALAISKDSRMSKTYLSDFLSTIEVLENNLPAFSRKAFYIPKNENINEVLCPMGSIVRPVVSSLVSYSKIFIKLFC